MRVVRVSRAELSAAARELLVAEPCRPPELASRAVGEREARYVATLRHGDDEASLDLLCLEDGRPVAAAALRPSPFDTEALQIPSAKLEGIYALSSKAAFALMPHLGDATSELGAELLLGRIAPTSHALAAVLDSGLQVFGATVLYAGAPTETAWPSAVEIVDGAQAVDEATSIVGLAFDDSHLARDSRIDGSRVRCVYEQWARAEAERGATFVLCREERGHAAAVAVCRQNQLARELLKIELWNLHLLATHPAWAGRGYGAKAAQGAVAHAAAHGASLVQTGVDTAAIHAQRVYASLGLRPASASFALHGWLC